METHPGEGGVKEEKFSNTRKPSHQRVCEKFWNLRGQYNWERKKKKPTEYVHKLWRCSTELTSATSEWGLNRDAQVAFLG